MGYMETRFWPEGSMRKSKFTDEQIVAILKQLDRDRVEVVAARHGVSIQTVYAWRKRFGLQSAAPRRHHLEQQLGEPVATDLEVFCAAHFGAPAINVIREAVKLFIADQLARYPEIKTRFDRLRQERTEELPPISEGTAGISASNPVSPFSQQASTDEVRTLRRN